MPLAFGSLQLEVGDLVLGLGADSRVEAISSLPDLEVVEPEVHVSGSKPCEFNC